MITFQAPKMTKVHYLPHILAPQVVLKKTCNSGHQLPMMSQRAPMPLLPFCVHILSHVERKAFFLEGSCKQMVKYGATE